MSATIIQFPGRRVRVPPAMMAMYCGEACQLLGVRNGLVQIGRIGRGGAVERLWVPAGEVTMWESIMAGDRPSDTEGAA